MESRVIHTRFWTDEYISSLSVKEKLLFLYFITNDKVNIAGAYELPDPYIALATGLTKLEINKIKKKLAQDGKFCFFESWVRIMNVDKYQTFTGAKNEVARKKQLAITPPKLLERNTLFETQDTPNNHNHNHNKKSVTSNHNQTDVLTENEGKALAVLAEWNRVHNTNFRAFKAIVKNMTYWLTVYSPDELRQAIENVKQDDFWRDKMTPTIMLRRKNPRGEEVDYIGELLNNARRVASKKRSSTIIR